MVDKVEQFGEEAKRTLQLRPGITDWASIWNSDEGGVLAGAPDPDEIYEKVLYPIKLKLQLRYVETSQHVGGPQNHLLYLVKNCPQELDSSGTR